MQIKDQTVADYFTKLKTLWDELGAYLALPNCKCTKELNLSKYFAGERVHQFLMGLDTKQFGTVRSNVLAIEPLPSLNKVYGAILQEERQQAMTKAMENWSIVEASTFQGCWHEQIQTNKSTQMHTLPKIRT